MDPEKTVYVFIDASNLWAVQKSKKKTFDFLKLKKFLKEKHQAAKIKVYYYDAFPDEGTREYSVEGKFRFYTFLEKNLKFVVRKKPLKQIAEGDTIFEKGNMDVEIAIDIVNNIENYDEAILFSGDSDFLALLKFIQNKGKKVFIYSSKNSISRELRTGGSGYFDILKVEENIWRGDLKRRE